MRDNVIYTKCAGKYMGNYDIKCIRHLTDQADSYRLKDRRKAGVVTPPK